MNETAPIIDSLVVPSNPISLPKYNVRMDMQNNITYDFVGKFPNLWRRFWFWLCFGWTFKHLHVWGEWSEPIKFGVNGEPRALQRRKCEECGKGDMRWDDAVYST